MIMSTVDMRAESHRILDRIDERFLAAVHALLRAYDQHADDKAGDDEIVGYRIGTGEPLLAREADEVFEAIVKDVKQGNYTEIDDLIAEKSKRW
jgi:hypothetical protein